MGAGKDSNIYVVNRDNMGKFNPNNDGAIYQEIDGALPGGVWSSPAYFNNTVYYCDTGETLKAFPISNAMLATTPSSQTGNTFIYPGATPTVSANQTSNAIVWAVANTNPAVLYAFDATNLANQLYNSNQAGTRDQFGPGNKFITPDDRQRQGFCGNTNRSRGVWPVAVSAVASQEPVLARRFLLFPAASHPRQRKTFFSTAASASGFQVLQLL